MLEGQTARLSGPALETLAIVAYKQPISRGADLGDPRRQRRGDAEDARRSAATSKRSAATRRPGNPSLYGTTTLFLERLGLDSLDQTSRRSATSCPTRRVVEALERGLRLRGEPDAAAIDDDESPDDEVAAELQSGLGEA